MNKTTKEQKPKRKGNDRPTTWPIKAFSMGTYRIDGRQAFQKLILALIQRWPLTDPERAVMAYIAEKIWRQGYCYESAHHIFLEIVPPNLRSGNEGTFSKAIIGLATLGLIDGTERTKCRKSRRRKYDIEILNVPLRNLLTNGGANTPLKTT